MSEPIEERSPCAESAAADQRSVEDFMRAAVERGITRWDHHRCGGCGYPCAYLIEGEGVLYDSGCWCGPAVSSPSPLSWQEMAEHYNRNQPSRNDRAAGTEWLAAMRAFWGFDQTSPIDGYPAT